MGEVRLSAGTIDYEDSGGEGPVIVFVGGLIMDSSLWHQVVAQLRGEFRCIAPTLPLGAHRHPMRRDADLTMRGIAGMLAEFLERLDLHDVTIVMNDWGGPQLLVGERDERIGALAFVACEAFDNAPPGLPGRFAALAGHIPGGMTLAVQSLRIRALRRLPFTYGPLSKRPVPDAIMDAWFRPAQTQRAVRRDLRKYVRTSAQGRRELIAAGERLVGFDRPALVVWAPEDWIMRPAYGKRLADQLPNSRLVEVRDSRTLIPIEQPAELARLLREFVTEHVTARAIR